MVIPDGGVDAEGRLFFLRRSIEVIAEAQLSDIELRAALAFLKEAQALDRTPEKVAQDIEASGRWAPILGILRDPAAATIVGILALLVAMMSVVLQLRAQEPSTTTSDSGIDIDRAVQLTQAAWHKRQPRAATKKRLTVRGAARTGGLAEPLKRDRTTVRGKAWRNARCRCGSGRRYRDCCAKAAN